MAKEVKICCFDGCDRAAKTRGYCYKHYNKLFLSEYYSEYRKTHPKTPEQKERHREKYRQKWGERSKTTPLTPEQKKEHHKIYRKIYYQKHKEEICEKHRIMGADPEEKIKKALYKKGYMQTEVGKESRRASEQKRRAIKKGVQAEFFKSMDVYERDNWVCGICGEVVDKKLKYPDPMSASLDHIVPLSVGGEHTKGNCQLAHLICNLKKGDRSEHSIWKGQG